MYKCEIEGCNWRGMIRSTIRNRNSNHYGKKCCPYHATKFNAYEKDQTNEYFSHHINRIKRGARCEESDVNLEPSKLHVCHIFPKRKYKSIANNLNNAMLYSWQLHSDFDRLIDGLDFEKLETTFPKSWGTVCEKAKLLLPLIEESGKLKMKFEEYLKQ